MRRLFIGGLVALVIAGAGWWQSREMPWWRVRVEEELPEARVRVARGKTAWYLGKPGVWERGMQKEGENNTLMMRVPKQVLVRVSKGEYLVPSVAGRGR
ncbi:MAG: hypothetical protein Kow002_14520 [Anaerolineales bacterium]